MAPLTAEDLKKNLGDRWWRLNNLYWILDKYGKPILFKPNRAQRRYLASRHFLNVNLKARQMGFSTAIQIDMLDRCLFNTNWNAGVIAQDLDTAQDIFDNKLKFAFERLPDPLKRKFATKQNNARKLEFANGSSVTVGTSLRGGTLQQLHISELGKIAAKYPDKAREIRTGALNTVAPGQMVDIESTAEGNEGEFFDRVQLARKHTAQAKTEDRQLREMEWKFHFFPWWEDPTYMIDPTGVVIPSRLVKYFDDLKKQHGIKLLPGQKAWYTLKEEDQGAEGMHREYPSHPDEAFEIAIAGAYYSERMQELRQAGRITSVPYSSELLVNTAWDLGMGDQTAIWFFQVIGREIRVIDYFEHSDANFRYYAEVLADRGYKYGRHFGPHDLAVRELFNDSDAEQPLTRQEIAKSHGINFEIVSRIADMRDGREAVRRRLPECFFDAAKCEQGIKALENYRREWNQTKGVYSNHPRHDWSSHGAKAFETLARAQIFGVPTGRMARPVQQGAGMGAWT